MENSKKEVMSDGNLIGQSFLFTGTLEQLKRSQAEAMVEEAGGSYIGWGKQQIELPSSGSRCRK
jgi:DNA ligase (NAD+)